MPPTSAPVYLWWHDDSRAATPTTRCADAAAAYAARFGRPPRVLLVPVETPDPLPAGAERCALVRGAGVWAGETTP